MDLVLTREQREQLDAVASVEEYTDMDTYDEMMREDDGFGAWLMEDVRDEG